MPDHGTSPSGRTAPVDAHTLARLVEEARADAAAATAWRKVVGWVEDFHMRPDGDDRTKAIEHLVDLITIEVFEGDA